MAFNNNNNGNYNNNRSNNDGAAFMVPHDGEKGPYWKGYVDLGNGKGLRLMMFPNNKDGAKSEFVVQVYKKTYDAKKSASNRAKW